VLFESLPPRCPRVVPHLTGTDQATLEELAEDMLRENALK
jgi:hypothetical protein